MLVGACVLASYLLITFMISYAMPTILLWLTIFHPETINKRPSDGTGRAGGGISFL